MPPTDGPGLEALQRLAVRRRQALEGVSYEELIASPADVLASLCAALELSYQPGQERFWEHTHHHLFGSGTVWDRLRLGEPGIFTEQPPEQFLDAAEGLAAEIQRSERVQAVVCALAANSAT